MGDGMRALNDFDYLPRRGLRVLRPLHGALAAMVLMVAAWIAHGMADMAAVRDANAQLQTRVDSYRRQINGARAGQPGRADAALQRQLADLGTDSGAAAAVMARVEQAWKPRIGLLSIAVTTKDGVGRAQINGVCAGLAEVYAFSARLRALEGPGKARVKLLRHGVTQSAATRVVTFALELEVS